MSSGSKSFPARRGRAGGERGDGGAGGSGDDGKTDPRFDRCLSGLELRIGSGPLKDMDAGRLKVQIMKWAKAVVSYARQLSFGSPRSRPASSPTTAKSGPGEAREEPPT